MLVTEFGMVTVVMPVQPEKVDWSMLVTEFGMVTEVKPVHPTKAYTPMLVTEYVTLLYVTLAGMTRSPVRLVYRGLPPFSYVTCALPSTML